MTFTVLKQTFDHFNQFSEKSDQFSENKHIIQTLNVGAEYLKVKLMWLQYLEILLSRNSKC